MSYYVTHIMFNTFMQHKRIALTGGATVPAVRAIRFHVQHTRDAFNLLASRSYLRNSLSIKTWSLRKVHYKSTPRNPHPVVPEFSLIVICGSA